MRVAWDYEEHRGWQPEDVSRSLGSPRVGEHVGQAVRERAPDLVRWSFDLYFATPSSDETRFIEVKGRSLVGPVDMIEREYRTGLALGSDYWLYVVWDCRTDRPRLIVIPNPMRLEWRPSVSNEHLPDRRHRYSLDSDVIRDVGQQVWPRS